MHILSPNISLAFFDPGDIEDKPSDNLVIRQISQVLSSPPFINFLLKLVPKNNREFKKIHYFSFPPDSFINDCILKKTVHLCYTTENNILQKLVIVEHHYVMIKHNIKDVFCNIILALHVWWFFRFYWKAFFYTKNRLSFRPSKLSFIIYQFIETFHWVF